MTSLQLNARSDALRELIALVEGSGPTRGNRLAPDASTWLADPEQGLTAEIERAGGPEAGAEALARLAPSTLTVIATVRSERACWSELVRHSAAEPETCLAGLTYEPGGRVSRIVWLRVPLVASGEVDAGDRVPDGRPVLEGYFAELMTSRFREAAAHFTEDTLYSHPPYARGGERVLFRGRNALRQGFETERGPSPARQIITGYWQQGGRAFVEGVVQGIPDGGSFFSIAEISRAGEIARYVAFYSATRIPGG